MGDEHTTSEEIWGALTRFMRPGQTYSLQSLYDEVQSRVTLVSGDFDPEAPGSSQPRWRRNVRNVLQSRRGSGHIVLVGNATYALV